jgi:hypothetical protein
MPLRVTLELIPHGDESKKRKIGVIDIENTGDHPKHPFLADYKYHMTGPTYENGTDTWHEGTLKDIVRSRGYWAHVKEVLMQCDCEAQPRTPDE